jgi:glycosyltransferase involved in cell wall biosynthesis
VVINTTAREELLRRTGIISTIVPNVIDFHQPPPVDMDAARTFRDYIGAKPDDLFFLQPTRVIQRKGIEHAIHLIHSLGRPGCKLVISHQAGDEGFEYAEWLERYARTLRVDLTFVDLHMDDPLGTHSRRYPEFTLYDIYPGADFVTYPSLYEGFGNGLLEAIYFKKPVLVNRYATYVRDIEPLGFDLAAIDGFLTPQAVERVCQLLDAPHVSRRVTEHNFQIAKKHFSYEVLQELLNTAMAQWSGSTFPKLDVDITAPATAATGVNGKRKSADTADVKWARAYN